VPGIENTGKVVGCNSLYRSAEPIEIMVEQAVVYILDTPELAKLLGPGDQDGDIVGDVVAQVEAKRRKLDELVDDYAADLLDRAQFARAKQTAEAALRVAEAALKALRD
jgi:site-specific DNA recombinase